MQEEIRRLIELQKIDLKILQIEKSIQEIPQSLQKAQKEKDQLMKKLEELNNFLEGKKSQKELFEEELKQEYQTLKSKQARLIQIRGAREYQVQLREIEETKKIIRQKEDEILKFMEEIENLEKEKEKLENKIQEVDKVVEEEKKKFNEFCAKLNVEKEKLLTQRENIAKKIPSNLLKKYEAIRKKKGGIGIAPVENYVCEGCHMAIPPQLYNEIQRDNRYYECPHCKRLIYYKRIYIQEENQSKDSSLKEASSL